MYSPDIPLDILRKTKKKKLVRIAGVLAKISTKYLSNTSLECYHYAKSPKFLGKTEQISYTITSDQQL